MTARFLDRNQLSSQALILAGLVLLALAPASLWIIAQALDWIAENPAERSRFMPVVMTLNIVSVGLLIGGLLIGLLRCDRDNQLRFLSVLMGSCIGLMWLLEASPIALIR